MRSAALAVINYKTAPLAIEAIRTARAASSAPLQVIAVDNSVDASEAEMLRPHADIVIINETNAGYAAAINRARREADADVLVVANPDVIFAAESIDRLVETEADVAGPALFWDDELQWLLPPSELHTTREVADRAAASRSAWWAKRRDRRRITARIAFWSLQRTTRVQALSGAVLAIRTNAFDAAGGFDERYRLYFEENDFLRRVHGPVVYVPQARCRHIYNQSAGKSAEAAGYYASSERAYLEKWSGTFAAAMLKQAERPLSPSEAVALTTETIDVPRGAWLEASPLPTFETAAGHPPDASPVAVSHSIRDAYQGDRLFLRAVDPTTGTVLATWSQSKMRV